LGFYPGAGLLVQSYDPEIVVQSHQFVDWTTIETWVSVDPDETPGLKFGMVVTNPNGETSAGSLWAVYDLWIFRNGFEAQSTSFWSGCVGCDS